MRRTHLHQRLDTLTRYQFPSTNKWGIPSLPFVSVQMTPQWLVPYCIDVQDAATDGGAIHFFLHDYRFESVWNYPLRCLPRLKRFTTVLTPDYSVYRYAPATEQLWNVYRNRWCGALWVWQGLQVIPSVAWSDSDSYDFAFLGIARHSMVAVSTNGVDLEEEWTRASFVAGFRELLHQVDPCRVVCYGTVPPDLYGLVEMYGYPTHWQGFKQARRQGVFVPSDPRRYAEPVGG